MNYDTLPESLVSELIIQQQLRCIVEYAGVVNLMGNTISFSFTIVNYFFRLFQKNPENIS
jgi:hypothetical protein